MHPLLDRAHREGAPIREGQTATFVWAGDQPPCVVGDFNQWGAHGALELLPQAPEVWAQTLTLPTAAYVEYVYMLGDRRVHDPFNRRRVPNGLGALNSALRMPDSTPTPLARRRPGVPRGILTRHLVRDEHLVIGGKRTVWLYQPPSAAPSPLLVVLDGQDYLRRARLTHVVDNLIAQGRIQPLALAFVAHGGQARFAEYACSESTLAFVSHRVLPLARAQLHLLDLDTHPGAYGMLGASMSGLMALYAGLRLPEVFGRVLSQSGAFSLRVRERDLVVFDLLQQGSARSLRVWMDVGTFEPLLEANQRMRAALSAHGYDVAYHEYPAGHNYTAWRDDVWRGLEAQFGVPS